MIEPPPAPVVVVAMRQATLPEPSVPSVSGACATCQAPVWLSSATARDLFERPGSRAVCQICVVLEVDEATEFALSDRTRAEVEAYRAGR